MCVGAAAAAAIRFDDYAYDMRRTRHAQCVGLCDSIDVRSQRNGAFRQMCVGVQPRVFGSVVATQVMNLVICVCDMRDEQRAFVYLVVTHAHGAAHTIIVYVPSRRRVAAKQFASVAGR